MFSGNFHETLWDYEALLSEEQIKFWDSSDPKWQSVIHFWFSVPYIPYIISLIFTRRHLHITIYVATGKVVC